MNINFSIQSDKTKNLLFFIVFGDLVPFGDPNWYQAWRSPYYNDSHIRFRAGMREFVERELMPFCHEWDEAKEVPPQVREKCFAAGWLPGVVGGLFLIIYLYLYLGSR